MTKVTVLNVTEPSESNRLGPIWISSFLVEDKLLLNSVDDGHEELNRVDVRDWDNVQLITRDTNNGGLDTFMVWDNIMVQEDGSIREGIVCFGQWNDGVVE